MNKVKNLYFIIFNSSPFLWQLDGMIRRNCWHIVSCQKGSKTLILSKKIHFFVFLTNFSHDPSIWWDIFKKKISGRIHFISIKMQKTLICLRCSKFADNFINWRMFSTFFSIWLFAYFQECISFFSLKPTITQLM